MGHHLAPRLLPLVLAALGASTAFAGGGRHPHFNDQGTLRWYGSLAEARQVATAEGRLILVEYGRLRCTQCRALCVGILPHPQVQGRIAQVAIGLATDADHPEPYVDRMLRSRLPYARTLPFVGFLTPDGEYVTGFAGGTSVGAFLGHLARAESALEAWRRAQGPPPGCAPAQPVPLRPPEPREREAPERRAPTARSEPAPRERPLEEPAAPRVAERPARGSDDEDCCAPPPRSPVPPSERPPPEVRTLPTVPVAPPSIADRPAAKTPRETGSRAARASARYPEPHLAGDPDAVAVDPPPGIARPASSPKHAPRSRTTPPAAGSPAASRGALAQAEKAAQAGRWGEVLLAARASPQEPRLAQLEREAHRWAHGRLDAAHRAAEGGRFEEALAVLGQVTEEMRGEPEAVDAERGRSAIRTLAELRFLNADGQVASVVRQRAFEEMRGSRWASLF